jgi:chromosome segregation ATPase
MSEELLSSILKLVTDPDAVAANIKKIQASIADHKGSVAMSASSLKELQAMSKEIEAEERVLDEKKTDLAAYFSKFMELHGKILKAKEALDQGAADISDRENAHAANVVAHSQNVAALADERKNHEAKVAADIEQIAGTCNRLKEYKNQLEVQGRELEKGQSDLNEKLERMRSIAG